MCTNGPGTATAFRKSHFHSFHFKAVMCDRDLPILVQLVPSGRNLSWFVKASHEIWPYPCCCPCFQRASIPVTGTKLRSDCFLFKRQMSEPHLNRGLVLALCSLYSIGCSLSFRKKKKSIHVRKTNAKAKYFYLLGLTA